MLGYYVDLAIRSLRRNIALTGLIVTVMGVGIGASMTVLTTLRAIGGDPIPRKAGQLFVPQIDVWGPSARHAVAGGASGRQEDSNLLDQLTYRDAMAFMKSHRAARQTAMYGVSVNVTNPDLVPFPVIGRAAYADFFRMFEVPFVAGAPWSAADDRLGANVVVLSKRLSDRLFPHSGAVGKTVNLDNGVYRVIGVIARWDPLPRFYDLSLKTQGAFADSEDMFLPFTTAIDHQVPATGLLYCKSTPGPGWEGRLKSECVWLQFWAELPNAAAVRDYQTFLYSYAAEQRQLGRFKWPPRVELHDVHAWMAIEVSVPDTLKASTAVAFGFLTVCLINALGLMLAQFSGRAGELGVRRALGAARRDIFAQCMIETAIIGLPGALLGLACTAAGLAAQRALHNVVGGTDAVRRLTLLDPGMVVITILLAVAATMGAGLVPAWRASRVQPALQLKM